MAIEDPPRHSRSPDEPVTIEATAERISESDSNPSVPDEPVVMPPEATSEPPPAETETGTENASGSPETTADTVEETARDEADRAADAAPLTGEPMAAPSGSTPPSEPPPTWTQRPAETATPPPKRASASAMIAAGIFGGLVALAGAGAMQYAGYLPGAPVTDTSALSADIDALRQELAARGGTPATDPALEQRLAALEAKIAPLEDSLGKAQSDLAAATQAAQAAQTGSGDLAARIDAVEKKLQEPQNDGAVARTIAATALRAAIDRGGSFVPELDALASVSDGNPSIEELRPLAQGGVPSRNALAERFPDVAFAMIDAVNQPGPDSGIARRLLSSAMSIVKVRDVGDVEGNGVEAVTARIEDRLKKGDLKAAATEWDKLPDAAKTAGASFKSALDERIRAEDLLSAAIGAVNKQN